MAPSTEDLFCLNVFVKDVTLVSEHGRRREVNGLALACRFLDYPLFFIHPQTRHERSPRCTFDTGKSCALSESKGKLTEIISKVPLYILLINYYDGSKPHLLGAGAAKLRLDHPGSSTPGDQHLVALYDPCGLPVAHARLQLQLNEHGTSMRPHFLKPALSKLCKPQKQGSGKQRRSLCDAGIVPPHRPATPLEHNETFDSTYSPSSLHVHCHVHSPSPPRRAESAVRRQKSPAQKKLGKASQKHTTARPMSSPMHHKSIQLPAGFSRVYPLSAPSTPAKPAKAAASRSCSVQPRQATAATQVPSQRHSSKASSGDQNCSDAPLASKASLRSSKSSRSSKKIKAAKRHGVAAQVYQQRLECQAQQDQAKFLPAQLPVEQVQLQHTAAMDTSFHQQTAGNAKLQPAVQPQGLSSVAACTACNGPYNFKPPAVEQITAVACEMMTLVSMRAAMSQVMDGLVHQWHAGFTQPFGMPLQPAASSPAPPVPPPAPPAPPPAPSAPVWRDTEARPPCSPLAQQQVPPAGSHSCQPVQQAWASPQAAGAATRATVDGLPPPPAAAVGHQQRSGRSTAPCAPAVRRGDSGAELVAVEVAHRPSSAAAAVYASSPVRVGSQGAVPQTGRIGATVASEPQTPARQPAELGRIGSHSLGYEHAAHGHGASHAGSAEASMNCLAQQPSADSVKAQDEPERREAAASAARRTLGADTPFMAVQNASFSNNRGGCPHEDIAGWDSRAGEAGSGDAAKLSGVKWVDGPCPVSGVVDTEGCARLRDGMPGQIAAGEDSMLQGPDAPEPWAEPSIGGFESIRTELSGAAADAGRAMGQVQQSWTGETDYTIASQSHVSSASGGSRQDAPRSTPVLNLSPGAPARRSQAQSAVSMSGSSLSGSIMSEGSISMASTRSPEPSQLASSHGGITRTSTLRPSAALAQTRQRPSATMSARSEAATQRQAPQAAAPAAVLPRLAASEAASSSASGGSSMYESMYDGSDVSIASSLAPSARNTAQAEAPALGREESCSELGASALDSSSDGGSRYSGENDDAIMAAARAFGRPSETFSGADDGGLLGLQMLDAYARANAEADGFEGHSGRYGGTGSARTSDIDRSLDGDSYSSGSSYDDGESSGASASEDASEGESGSDDGFSDMEW